MRRIVLSGLITILLLTAIITVRGDASASNISNANAINANNYTLRNLSHLSGTDLTSYISVNKIDPYYAQVLSLKSQGLNNSSIVKVFADNGIFYDPADNVIAIGGRPATKDEVAKSIAPTNPFSDTKTSLSSNNMLVNPASTPSNQADYVFDVFNNQYQGVQENMAAGTLATSSNVFQHLSSIHMGANGWWLEIGVVNFGSGNRPYVYDPSMAGAPWGGWYYYDGQWDVSANTFNNYQLLTTYQNGAYYTYALANGNVRYDNIGSGTTLNNNVNSANEAWTNAQTMIWDAHDTVRSTTQNMYIESNGAWAGWQVAGAYIHLYPILGNPYSAAYGTYQGTAQVQFWLR